MNSTKEKASGGKSQRSQPRLADLPELEIVIGPRIAAARRSKGLTQYGLATRIPCHQTTIAFIETRKQIPSRLFTDRLVELLDIPLFELLRAPDPWELTLKVGRDGRLPKSSS